MDGWTTDRLTDGWKDRQAGGLTDRWAGRRADGWTDDRQMDR